MGQVYFSRSKQECKNIFFLLLWKIPCNSLTVEPFDRSPPPLPPQHSSICVVSYKQLNFAAAGIFDRIGFLLLVRYFTSCCPKNKKQNPRLTSVPSPTQFIDLLVLLSYLEIIFILSRVGQFW